MTDEDAKPWNATRAELERLCFDRGFDVVADAIPADRATVYRLVNGQTSRPTRAVRAGVERLIETED